MRTNYRGQVRAAAEALHIEVSNDLSWRGHPIDRVAQASPETSKEELTARVTGVLYRAFYVYGEPVDVSRITEQPLTLSGSAQFVQRLVAANTGRGYWRHDATVTSRDGNEVVIDHGGAGFRVPAGSVAHKMSDTGVIVEIPGVLPMSSPGFVSFVGDCGPPRPIDGRLARLYWNVTSAGAPILIAAVTDALNIAAIPFQLKVHANDQPWTARADAAVLYLDRRDVAVGWSVVRAIHQRLRPLMRAGTPALTRRLAQGLALADDPGNTLSFGVHRCSLVAEGFVEAHLHGCASPDEQVDAVADIFAATGHSIDAPYLHQDAPEIELDDTPRLDSIPISVTCAPTRNWMGAAGRLADMIARQALWHERRCTWLERSQINPGVGGWQPMGSDLYGGLAGIGLMFAQLWSQTRDPGHRRHAYGALRQVLVRLPEEGGSPGLYTGSTGAGLGITLAGLALEDSELLAAGTRAALQGAQRLLDDGHPSAFDLLNGLAGAVVVLLRLHHTGAANALEMATALGMRLVEGGTRTEQGMCWMDKERAESVALVGMAHGAAGCVWALAELASVTGDDRFRDAAERGCRYERSWFDPQLNNWADLRDSSVGSPGLAARWDRFSWCYGAPGIALSRIRMAHLTGSLVAADEATAAVSATRAAATSFPRLCHDASLCDGAAGLAEVLTLTPAELSRADDVATAHSLVGAALAAYQTEGPWPGGCGLMVGAAGVVYAALRMTFPEVPSPFMVPPASDSW